MEMNATLQYFQIKACGYFPRGAERPRFGGIEFLMSDLASWVLDNNLPVRETITYSNTDGDDILPTYCLNLRGEDAGKTWLLTMWNETELHGDTFGSVQGDAAVGQAQVDGQEVPAGGIAGFPSYIWVVPDRNLLVSVRFKQRLNGHREVRRYFQGFLHSQSSHVRLAEEENQDGTYDILGWADTENSAITRFSPRFDSRPLRAPGELAFIRENVDEIRRVYIKKELQIRRPKDRGFFQKMMEQLNVPRKVLSNTGVTYKSDFACRLSEQELEKMIDAYDKVDFGLADVGFRMSNESNPRWLSKSSTLQKLQLNAEMGSDGVIDSESLLAELQARRRQSLPLRSLTRT